MQRSQEALIRSEQLASIGRMAATVTHEINNPLAAVTNYIYLAASNPKLPPDVKEILESADRQLKQISDITRRTLGFYRENTKPCAVDICSPRERGGRTLQSQIQVKRHPPVNRPWRLRSRFCGSG